MQTGKMTRFLVVVHYFAPHIGGMEEVAEKQTESLVKRGHEVQIVTCRPNASAPLREKNHGRSIRRLRSWNFIENTFGVTFPIISPLYIFSILRMMRTMDIVHIHDVFYMSSHITAIAALLAHKPFYLTQHVAMVDHPSKLVMAVQHIVYRTFGSLLFKHAHNIVCYNKNVREFLIQFGVDQSKIVMNYNGIDTDEFTPVDHADKLSLRKKYSLPSTRPIVIFVGRLVPKKGFDLMYHTRSSQYLTLIVGPGGKPSTMSNDENVLFFGSADHAQLRELYALSDVFVFPAIGEIFTLVMQEAMAAGLPVITTDDPAYETYELPAGAIRFVSRDSRALKSAIEHIVSDASTLKNMSKLSRQIAEQRFSWENNYAHEYAIYGTSNT